MINMFSSSKAYQQVAIETDDDQYIYPPLNLGKDHQFGHSEHSRVGKDTSFDRRDDDDPRVNLENDQFAHCEHRQGGKDTFFDRRDDVDDDNSSFSELLQGRDFGFRESRVSSVQATFAPIVVEGNQNIKNKNDNEDTLASVDLRRKERRKSDICEWPEELDNIWQDHGNHPLSNDDPNLTPSAEFVVQGTVEILSLSATSGITFQRTDEVCLLKIKSFAPGSPLLQTALKPGMVVLEINNREMTWASPKEAIAEIQKAKPGMVTIKAIAPSTVNPKASKLVPSNIAEVIKTVQEEAGFTPIDVNYEDPSIVLMETLTTATDESSITIIETDTVERIHNKSPNGEASFVSGHPKVSKHSSILGGMVMNDIEEEEENEPILVETYTESEEEDSIDDSIFDEVRQQAQDEEQQEKIKSQKQNASRSSKSLPNPRTEKREEKSVPCFASSGSHQTKTFMDAHEGRQDVFCNALDFQSSPILATIKDFSFVKKFPVSMFSWAWE